MRIPLRKTGCKLLVVLQASPHKCHRRLQSCKMWNVEVLAVFVDDHALLPGFCVLISPYSPLPQAAHVALLCHRGRRWMTFLKKF